MVTPPGLEPELAEPKSAVLPITPRGIVAHERMVTPAGLEPELAEPESAVLPITPRGSARADPNDPEESVKHHTHTRVICQNDHPEISLVQQLLRALTHPAIEEPLVA